MTINLDSELEAAVAALARRTGATPEESVLQILRRQLLVEASSLEPRDDWERRILAIATDCGVSLPDSALGRDEIDEL